MASLEPGKNPSQNTKGADENSQANTPLWLLANEGIKMLINDKPLEAEALFGQYPDQLVMFAGHSFVVFMDALMSFDEDKLDVAILTLKEVEERCSLENGWVKSFQKIFSSGSSNGKALPTLADQLETQIILADSQVCLATLTFLQQDISAYLKGGWVLRKAWKVYQKVYKDILDLYREAIGDLHLPDPVNNPIQLSDPENEVAEETTFNGYLNPNSKIPNSRSEFSLKSCCSHFSENESLKNNSDSIKNKSDSLKKDTDSIKTDSDSLKNDSDSSKNVNAFTNSNSDSRNSFSKNYRQNSVPNTFVLEKSSKKTSRPKSLKLKKSMSVNNGLSKQIFWSLNRLSPLNTSFSLSNFSSPVFPKLSMGKILALLWYHTIIRPFYAVDGTNVQAGLDSATLLLKESETEFADSALFSFFRGRAYRLSSNIPSAIQSYQLAVENATQREIKLLALHEVGWCHLIELDYVNAESIFSYLRTSSRWSKIFYGYLSGICVGCFKDRSQWPLFEELREPLEKLAKSNQIEEFLRKRVQLCPSTLEGLNEISHVFWRLLLIEMIYLWNSLPSCNHENIKIIIRDCKLITKTSKEPMPGLSKLLLGASYCILKKYDAGIACFRECLSIRKDIPNNASDTHISAYAQFELGYMLFKNAETKNEGKTMLQEVYAYGHYDFDTKLNVRVHNILKNG